MNARKQEAHMSNEERIAILETTNLSIHQTLLDIRNRFDSLERDLNRRFDQIDKRFDQVDRRFEQVDKRFEQVDKRFELMEKKFEKLDDRIEHINQRLWYNFIWTMSMIIGVSGLIAHAQHWI